MLSSSAPATIGYPNRVRSVPDVGQARPPAYRIREARDLPRRSPELSKAHSPVHRLHGVGASSRSKPCRFKSDQKVDGIGLLNHARFCFSCSTVRVPAMKDGITGCATTN